MRKTTDIARQDCAEVSRAHEGRAVFAALAAVALMGGTAWAAGPGAGPGQGGPAGNPPAQGGSGQGMSHPGAMPVQGAAGQKRQAQMQQREADMQRTMQQIRTTRNAHDRLMLMQRQMQMMHTQMQDMMGEMRQMRMQGGMMGGAEQNMTRMQTQMRDMLQMMNQMLEQQRSMLQSQAGPSNRGG